MRAGAAAQLAYLVGEAFLRVVSGVGLVVVLSQVRGVVFLGEYSLVLAWLTLFQFFVSLGIPELTLREIGRVPEGESRFLSHLLIIGFLSSIGGTLLLAAGALLAGGDGVRGAIVVGALTLFPATVATISRAAFLAHGEAGTIFLLAVLELPPILVVSVYIALEGGSVLALVVTLVVAKVVVAVVSIVVLHGKTTRLLWGLDPPSLKRLLPLLFTFAASSSLGMISARLNLILLSFVGSMASVGLYAAATKVVEMAIIVPSIFAQMLLPRLSRAHAEKGRLDERDLDRLLPWMFVSAFSLAIGLSLAAPTLMMRVFGAEFGDATVLVRLLILYFAFEVIDTAASVVMKASGRQVDDVRLYTANPIVNVLVTLLLAPVWGAAGAAVGRLAGAMGSVALRSLYIRRYLAPASRQLWDVGLTLLSVVAVLAVTLIAGRLEGPVLLAGYVFAGAGAAASLLRCVRRGWSSMHPRRGERAGAV